MSFMKLKLVAETPTEQRVLDYLNENASEVLTDRINSGKKTLAGALNYAKSEARKLDEKASCVCVDDETVFGWIVHFFEEDEIKEDAGKGPRVPAGVKKAKPVKKKAEKPNGPIIMDLFTGEPVSAQ